jgi:hypothetical protein
MKRLYCLIVLLFINEVVKAQNIFVENCLKEALKAEPQLYLILPVKKGEVFDSSSVFFYSQWYLQGSLMSNPGFKKLRKNKLVAYDELLNLIPVKRLNNFELYFVLSCLQDLSLDKYIKLLNLIFDEIPKNNELIYILNDGFKQDFTTGIYSTSILNNYKNKAVNDLRMKLVKTPYQVDMMAYYFTFYEDKVWIKRKIKDNNDMLGNYQKEIMYFEKLKNK